MQVSERAGISRDTLRRVETGDTGVGVRRRWYAWIVILGDVFHSGAPYRRCMEKGRKRLLSGGITFAGGLGLWLFTGGIDTPVITLTKVGVVLMVVGVAEALYGLYLLRRPA